MAFGNVNVTGGDRLPVTTAGTGAAYTAQIPGVTSLYKGLKVTIIPHTVSTSATPTLNINSLGAKTIKRRLGTQANSQQNGYTSSWLASGYPFELMYDGTYWVVAGLEKPVAADLSGTLGIAKGGTGASTAEAARNALLKDAAALTDTADADSVFAYDASAAGVRKITLPVLKKKLGGGDKAALTGTIGTTWTENSDTGVKSQNVAISGLTAANNVLVDHDASGNNGTAEGYAAFVEAENQYLSYITNGYAVTYNGGITFYIFGDANTVSIPIVVEVV